jgi:EamA domain-containing membrane protein RarD
LYAVSGAAIGGLIAPLVLFLLAAIVFRDTGGPLFWPVLSVLLGLIGLGVGAELGRNYDDV